MSFGARLELRQGQHLVMTPQLQQAIRLLQMSNLELSEYVAEELERNPLLEERDQGEAAPEAKPEAEAGEISAELREDRLDRAEETFDTGLENIYADQARADAQNDAAAREAERWAGVGSGGGGGFDSGDVDFEGRLSRDLTLREHLIAQLSLAELSPGVRLIAAELIEHIDEAGYLRADLEEIADRLGADGDAAEAALCAIHAMEPTGVGARSLSECLALQLIEQDRYDPAMRCFIENLPLVAKGLTPKLAKLCEVDQEDLMQMMRELRLLDPKPGAKFDYAEPQTLIPDVYVRANALGGWTAELNSDTLPKVLVNNRYAAEVKGGADGSVQAFLTECAQNANWLLKSIDQRAKTILKVAGEIIRQQDGFFAYGVRELRPLNLKMIADVINMHESTVSRVTSNKYMATDRGVFEMKYFFTAAIASTDGEDVFAAEAVRRRIKDLIDAETAKTVLSDEKIVRLLRDSGIDIARRTVAKYREAMNIPSSVQRRRRMAAMV